MNVVRDDPQGNGEHIMRHCNHRPAMTALQILRLQLQCVLTSHDHTKLQKVGSVTSVCVILGFHLTRRVICCPDRLDPIHPKR